MTLVRPSRRGVLLGVGGLAAALGLQACGQGEAPLDEQGRVRLRLAAPGPARADHGGFYQAIANGAYEKRNLNIQIWHGNSAEDVSARLASGEAELGLGQDSFAALRLIAEPAPVKAVAAFFQKDPRVLIVRESAEVEGLADLQGRPLLMADGAWSDVWSWLQSRYGYAPEQARSPSDSGVAAFLEDPEAVLVGSLTREPAQLAAAAPDLRARLLLPADDGYPSYSALVLAPNAFARDNAQALRDFVAASAEGWRDYVHGEGRRGDALIRRANPATPQGSLEAARELLRAHAVVDGGDAALYGLGTMTAERWRAFAEQTAHVYAGEPDWREAFTTQYLPARG